MSKKEIRSKKKWVVLCIVGLILLFLILIWWLFSGSEIHISEGLDEEKAESLVCSAGDFSEAFFYNEFASNVENKIKILFVNDKLDKVFYSYSGSFAGKSQAESVNGVMHAKYDIYFGENNASRSVFNSIFSNVGNEVRINIFGEYDSINPVTAVFFFLDGEDIDSEKDYTMSELGEFYIGKGFSCEYDKGGVIKEEENEEI